MSQTATAESSPTVIARLRAELAEARARVDEMAAYYRGELEALRQRSEAEMVRSQADAAGRRKRAEEEAARLADELAAVRREAEQAQRRYATLVRDQEEAEAAGQAPASELVRLDREVRALQTRLDTERAERRELERVYDDLKAQHRRTEARWHEQMSRLRRGFKASEQRRKTLEARLRERQAEERVAAPEPQRAESRRRHQAELKMGWGQQEVTFGDDLADEFTLIEGDRSLGAHEKAEQAQEAAGSPPESVSPGEAEHLLAGLNVDRRVAQRPDGATITGAPAADGGSADNGAAVKASGGAGASTAPAGDSEAARPAPRFEARAPAPPVSNGPRVRPKPPRRRFVVGLAVVLVLAAVAVSGSPLVSAVMPWLAGQ
ncbi:hypothetical protein KBTX_02691 [wastewater metagenome]|uniref:Uncharacterized protein n=2 Tax=unclassified sequences TaxID=12908 RepID=A0A5B8RAZ0_9ZZZZ|nr:MULTISPECIES: hypothetical protein [Arhodomonas]QEA06359.1 hypothetical protein KBTEX_02691 [uncultured organism]